jgi:hypothetical protein
VPEILQLSQVVWIIWSNKLTYHTVVISNELDVGRRDHSTGLMEEITLRKDGTTTHKAFTVTIIITLTDIQKAVNARKKRVRVKPDRTDGETPKSPPPSRTSIDPSIRGPKNS